MRWKVQCGWRLDLSWGRAQQSEKLPKASTIELALYPICNLRSPRFTVVFSSVWTSLSVYLKVSTLQLGYLSATEKCSWERAHTTSQSVTCRRMSKSSRPTKPNQNVSKCALFFHRRSIASVTVLLGFGTGYLWPPVDWDRKHDQEVTVLASHSEAEFPS